MNARLLWLALPRHIREIPFTITLAILLQVPILAVALSPISDTDLSLLSVPVVALYCSVLPGTLLLSLANVRLNRLSSLIYAVAASLLSLMVFGGAISYLHVQSQWIPAPFTPSALPSYLLLFTGSLTAIVWATGRRPQLPPKERLSGLVSRVTLIGVGLVPLAILGAWYINWYEINTLLLLVLTLVAVLPLLTLWTTSSRKQFAIVSWAIAATLLFQNAQIDDGLSRGDASNEHFFTLMTLGNGYWDFSIQAARTTSLSFTVLHPMTSLLSGLDPMWAMKTFYPLWFALTPVAIFCAGSRQFNNRIGFGGAVLFSFSYPFFTILASNTRTGIALLFVSAFVLVLIDNNLKSTQRRGLAVAFIFGVIFAHYGTTPLIVVVLLSVLLLELVNRTYGGDVRGRSIALPVAIIGIGLYLYWSIVGNGFMVRTITNVVSGILMNVIHDVDVSSSAGTGAGGGMPSLTYTLIQLQYPIIFLITGVGVALSLCHTSFVRRAADGLGLSHLIDRVVGDISTPPIYVFLASGALVLIPISFLPGVGFGIARVVMISLVFATPFTIFAIYRIFPSPQLATSTLGVALALILIVNAGVYGALAGEVTPQPNLIRDEIRESGDGVGIFHLWRHHQPDSDANQASWIGEYRDPNANLHRGKSVTIPYSEDPAEATSGESPIGGLMTEDSFCDGYLYLTSMSFYSGEVVTDPSSPFINYQQSISLEEIDSQTANSPLVYSSNTNRIYYGCH